MNVGNGRFAPSGGRTVSASLAERIRTHGALLNPSIVAERAVGAMRTGESITNTRSEPKDGSSR